MDVKSTIFGFEQKCPY